MRIKKYYCTECGRFLNRTQVKCNEWEELYSCRVCDEVVIKTRLVMYAVLKDYIDYVVEKNDREDFE